MKIFARTSIDANNLCVNEDDVESNSCESSVPCNIVFAMNYLLRGDNGMLLMTSIEHNIYEINPNNLSSARMKHIPNGEYVLKHSEACKQIFGSCASQSKLAILMIDGIESVFNNHMCSVEELRHICSSIGTTTTSIKVPRLLL